MIDYFKEKAAQISQGTIETFGITLTSRYSNVEEIGESGAKLPPIPV